MHNVIFFYYLIRVRSVNSTGIFAGQKIPVEYIPVEYSIPVEYIPLEFVVPLVFEYSSS